MSVFASVWPASATGWCALTTATWASPPGSMKPASPDLTALLGPDGSTARPPYSLGDMADDAAGLLDALEIDRVHAVGALSGRHDRAAPGDQAPRAAEESHLGDVDHRQPENPGGRAPRHGQTPRAAAPRPRRTASRGPSPCRSSSAAPPTPLPEADVRARAVTDAFERAAHPQGAGRQLAAIFSDGDRSAANSAPFRPRPW